MPDSAGDPRTAIPHRTDPSPVVEILGCRIHRASFARVIELAREFLRDGSPHLIVTADSSMLSMATDDSELREIINEADLVVPDSVGVVWAASQMGAPVPERIPGVDLMERLCELGGQTGAKAYFLGAAPGVAEEAARKLEAKYPGFKVCGTHHGFLRPGDDEKIESQILELKPEMLFVAMGIPRQEKWIWSRMHRLNVPISMGVGGSFDCHSGRVKRAPILFQKLNIEWLHRLVMNPKKYQKAAHLPIFAMKILRQGRVEKR